MKMRIDMYGPVTFKAVPYAQEKIEQLEQDGDPMIADVRLLQLTAPAIPHPAVAHAHLTWRGHSIEAHASGRTIYGAIDVLCVRLQGELMRVTEMNERRPGRAHAVGA